MWHTLKEGDLKVYMDRHGRHYLAEIKAGRDFDWSYGWPYFAYDCRLVGLDRNKKTGMLVLDPESVSQRHVKRRYLMEINSKDVDVASLGFFSMKI